ncbi:MAG: phage holin family protein [Clostridiales bacterium]|nr:phage holin family protein [Clostridiales bacterium]
MKNMLQTTSAVIGGFLGYFLGGFDGFLYALLTFVVVDYLTGVMVAIVNKELSSQVGFKGIFKKVMIFLMVGIAHIVDTQLLGNNSVLRTAVIFFYCSNEGISILENASLIGLPVPKKLQDILAQLKDKGGDDNGGN